MSRSKFSCVACLELSLVGLLHALHLPQPLLLGNIIQPLSLSCHLILMLPQGCLALSLKQAQLLPFLQEHVSSPAASAAYRQLSSLRVGQYLQSSLQQGYMCTRQVLSHTTYTYASKPGCVMGHNWLHTPDYKI